jgi:asparagine synthase (glutamine-hydrolysing)
VCGIVGALDLDDRRAFPRERLAAMLRAIAHRGPDGEGVYAEPGIALGARRLALVDPAGGEQPFADAAGRFHAVANGELFEHAAERARLLARGARFRSRCDTEVWPHAFAAHGEGYLARARGQFAVAVWDRDERRLVLARDRFGICPLYTARAAGWLLFASEIKGLFASGLVTPALDPRGIDHVLACLCASPVRSAFEGVAPVPPGHRLVADRSGVVTARFAGIEFPERGAERRPANARELDAITDELGARLDRAIELRLAADAPVATYLSGGVDSSLLVARAARARGEITAFSVRLDGIGRDEAELAATMARRIGARHVAVPIGAREVAALFPEVVRAAELPVLDHAAACLLALARAVREHGFKAVLTGEGADEAFAGYPWVGLVHRVPAGVADALGGLLGALVGGGSHAFAAPGTFGRTAAARLYGLTSRVRAFLYAPAMRERLGSWTAADDHVWDPRVRTWDPLHASLYADYELILGGHLLVDKGDRVAMAAPVELRFPFLDEGVVDFAAQLHPSLKLRMLADKWLLRRLAARYLPVDVAHRRKHMFRAAPVIHAAGRPRWVDQLLSPASLRATAMFEPVAVARALARRTAGDRTPRGELLEMGLSAVISTQLLHHLFCGGGLCELPA